MADAGTTRRLTAIIAADVAGYSRLTGRDEEGTIAALRAHRRELIDPKVAEYRGRIVNTAGDSILIEFPSVVEALRCAIDMQRGMAERNAEVPEDARISFRLGVNLGDVIEQDGDLLGDGVNIAARLEGLADPGGICLSRAARDQVRDRIDIAIEDMGEVEVKNIARPVRVFRVLYEGQATSSSRRFNVTKFRLAVAAAAMIVAIVGGALWWWQPWIERVEPADLAKMKFALPDKPSIAVLPFQNMSDDASQEYFADGMTQDIITDLSKVSGLYVTSRSATLRFRGRADDPRGIAAKLGVGYILEGSVRRAGDRLRITATLIDAETGDQLWAERYDRDTRDVFAIQDEIAERVVAQLSVTLKGESLSRVVRNYTPNVDAYDLYIRGRAKRIPPTPGNLAAALQMFEKAIEIDPKFAGGYAGAAFVHVLYVDSTTLAASPSDHLETALRLAKQAVALDPTFGPGYGSLAEAHTRMRQYDEALAAIQKAIQAAPSDSLMRALYGRILGYAGMPEEGIKQVKLAMHMSPDSLPLLFFLGANYRAVGQFEKSIEALTEHRKRLGGRILTAPTTQLIAAYMQAGLLDEARATVEELLTVVPHFTLQLASRTHAYKDPEHMKRFLGALRQAGLPEK